MNSKLNLIFSKLHKYKNINMIDLFNSDKHRFLNYHLKIDNLLVDYSKNYLNNDMLNILYELLQINNFTEKKNQLFDIDNILNITEEKMVSHVFLRDLNYDNNNFIFYDDDNNKFNIKDERNRLFNLVENIHNGVFTGYSGCKITDIVHIGIGGSELGPKMVVDALYPYYISKINIHFLSNVDGDGVHRLLLKIRPETTLFIIVSKSFTTQETLLHANYFKSWLKEYYHHDNYVDNHFLAISSNYKGVLSFGLSNNNYYPVPNSLVGRFSLWSSVGITIIFAIGKYNYLNLLKGANYIDSHFKSVCYQYNIPIILSLISILYINVYNCSSQLIVPYDNRLRYLPSYLQQLYMESHGKNISLENKECAYNVGSIIWGDIGTNSQHSFHQFLHQNKAIIPTDFIVIKKSYHNLYDNQHHLLANCLSQSHSMLKGSIDDKIIDKNIKNNFTSIPNNYQHKYILGNKPHTLIVLDSLNPYNLGMLISLYEHIVFIKGVIWNINTFDQWGVELGKKISKSILKSLIYKNNNVNLDSSTNNLINYLRNN